MSGTLTITREGFGIELRRGTFQIELDGVTVGTIENGGILERPVDPGRHSLRIDAGRYSSKARSFDIADGEGVSFRCHGANLWPIWVASLVKPDLGISLRRE